ncbi:MAG: aminopeptidase N [Candidatus Tokpelaia sp. JSC188]|nr:MAG: aminopeptidase N [Candidatus Tokpelaia sp. JSC188]
MNSYKNPVFCLDNYQITPYAIPHNELCFFLETEKTQVIAKLFIEKRENIQTGTPLVLNGDNLNLISISIDGESLPIEAFNRTMNQLEIHRPPSWPFVLEIITEINPDMNQQLVGLYRSNGIFCTQCEPEGFRRITYFYDRPDVLSIYTVRIEADQKSCPVLLSNGNLKESGLLMNGRHFVLWHDPFPKPSYLFALVGGDLESVRDYFMTNSGKNVALAIYVEKGKASQAFYAIDVLKRAMHWDEKVFNCEYDLDVFNIVAIPDFNAGAMENKGLNIFNDKYVLANSQIATDSDYANIERIIAHEYFHNWTGNRITCRDWFQLCLKEGLTVYRDQEFSASQRSASVQRISDVHFLMVTQFPEDVGPLAHPVRPRQYIEINNFYTATVYEKGAEIIRMIHTLLGDKLFRVGLDLYFKRHDGHACIVEDLISCFSEVSNRDFSQFMLWYEQVGTPHVKAQFDYHEKDSSFTITLEQSLHSKSGQTSSPMVIPVRFGLCGTNGKDMAYQTGSDIEGDVMLLTEKRQSFCFTAVTARPIPSLLRGFSAPITLDLPLKNNDRVFLARYDTDLVNRWQALNQLLIEYLVISSQNTREISTLDCNELTELIGIIANDDTLEPAFRALCITLPSEVKIASVFDSNVDPDRIFRAREALFAKISRKNGVEFTNLYEFLAMEGTYLPDPANVSKRALKNALLGYIVLFENSPDRLAYICTHANNMTDRVAALRLLVQRFLHLEECSIALKNFEQRFSTELLAIDKWFTVQAAYSGDKALELVKKLTQHPLFSYDNPNRVRALIGTFASCNQIGFNRKDGAGYAFLAKIILLIDKKNPQLAANLLMIMHHWYALENIRKTKIKAELKKIALTKGLSKDVSDVIIRMFSHMNHS